GERNLSTRHAGDFTGKIAGVMRPMRKPEAEDIPPEGQRSFDVADRETGVICGYDIKWHSQKTSNVQRPTSNVEFRGAQAASLFVSAACRDVCSTRFAARKCCRQAAGNCRLAACAPQTHPTAAMTLSSIVISGGSAVTSTVVRVGFGLPGPAKCSA